MGTRALGRAGGADTSAVSGMVSTSAPDLDAFVADLGPRLVATLTVQTGEPMLAEELAQETLIRCVQHWDKVVSADRPDAWAFRTAFNLTRSRWRRLRLERRVAAELSAATSRGDDGTGPPRSEELVMLRKALAGLPERRRAVVVCRYLLGYDVRTTAQVLGCAEGTVKAQTSKGLDQLREALGETGGTEAV